MARPCGWLREPPSAHPGAAALVIHGWGGSAIDMLPVSESLLALGLPVLLLDARGHGRSDDAAVVSMPAFAEDVRTALNWMRAQPHVDPARILLAGHSVGAEPLPVRGRGRSGTSPRSSLASMADPSMFMAQRLNRWLPRPADRAGAALRRTRHRAPVSELAPSRSGGSRRRCCSCTASATPHAVMPTDYTPWPPATAP